MRRNFVLIILVFGMMLSCDPDPMLGCTDPQALNEDFGAEENDGSCQYSNVSFYAKYPAFNGIPITRIVISVDGNEIGALNGTVYPNGPGNCSAPGNVSYKFSNSDPVDWNTIVYLANGSNIFGSGRVSPSRSTDCLRINVTQ